MLFEVNMARRYLSTRHSSPFVSFLQKITVVAVATGVFALIVTLAVMEGFERDFRQRITGFKAPLTVEDRNDDVSYWQKLDPRIHKAVAFAEGEAVLKTVFGDVSGVRVRGVSEPPEAARLGSIEMERPFGADGLLIGDELAATLRLSLLSEEGIQLIFPFGDLSPTGDLLPRVRTLHLSGIFRSGFYDFDSKYVIVSYEEASRLLGSEARRGVEIWVDEADAESVKKVLQAVSPTVTTWRDQNPKLFAAMKLEKIGMFLLLGLVLVVASFNLFGITSLTVLEKLPDMAVLRACGLKASGVFRIFLLQAIGIGARGAIIGGALGLLASWIFTKYPVPLPTTYYLEHLPIIVVPGDVLSVLLLVPVTTALASFFPARRAARLATAEALRYE